MAALVVQSRFAGLKIEDDDYPPSSDSQRSKKNKTGTAKKAEPPKKTKINPATKSQTAPKKKKPRQPGPNSEQWEMWKMKDEELVDGNFENELQQAILLSKLDYEEKKDVYSQFKKEADIEKKLVEQGSRNNKKQKKKNVMSLEQFNDMVNLGEENRTSFVTVNHEDEKDSIGQESPKSIDKDTEFFNRIKDEAKQVILKDKANDRYKSRLSVSDDIITKVQFIDALEKKDKEIEGLKQEVIGLKQELLTVKSRNRKLCNILGQGEMKDKAEVVAEAERLRGVADELTAELAALHSELERERSRHADCRLKDKRNTVKKKNIRFDVSSEAIISKESSSGTA